MGTEKKTLTRGRPKVADLAKNRTIKLTDSDWARFRALGGAKWLREKMRESGDFREICDK